MNTARSDTGTSPPPVGGLARILSPLHAYLRSKPSGQETRILAAVLVLFLATPLLVVTHPQATGYAAHLARYYIMLQIDQVPDLARYYTFDWQLVPNQGVDLLMVPLGGMLGAERAGWLIAVLLPILTGAAILIAEWTLRGRITIASLLALVTVWSPAMIMGFSNFLLSQALALLAFALWVRMRESLWRWPIFLVAGCAIWLCHATGWGILGVLVFGYEWHIRRGISAFAAPLPLCLPFALMAAGGEMSEFSFGPSPLLVKGLFWASAVKDQFMQLDLIALAALVAAIIVAVRARALDGRLAWAGAIFVALTIALPRQIGLGDYADWRLTTVSLMVLTLAIDARVPRYALLALVVLLTVKVGVTAHSWHSASQRLDSALTQLDMIPRGSRVAGVVTTTRRDWAFDHFGHATSFATVKRDAFVNSHFALPNVHMLGLTPEVAGLADPSHRLFVRENTPIDLSDFGPAESADYLWYFGERAPDALPPDAQILATSENAMLVRLANGASGR